MSSGCGFLGLAGGGVFLPQNTGPGTTVRNRL
ncbi:MAG: hypothetical protein ACJASY_002397, partial [Halioglobus sp.]